MISGNVIPLGIFYVELEIGSPGTSFLVAVDSGSCTLLVPGKNCSGCHLDHENEYDPSTSSTSYTVPCPSISYTCISCDENYDCTFSNSYQTCNLTDPNQVLISRIFILDI